MDLPWGAQWEASPPAPRSSAFGFVLLVCCVCFARWEPGGVHVECLLPVVVTFLKGAHTVICNLKEQPPKRWDLPTEVSTSSWLFLIKAPHCNWSMYIIGRVNVSATAFPLSPLSLSVIQRHDLWFVSDFQHHPSSPGFTTGLRVVNHAEGLSLIPLNPFGLRFRVALCQGTLCKVAVEGAGGIDGDSGTVAFIAWSNLIIIQAWVSSRPGSAQPMLNEKLTPVT